MEVSAGAAPFLAAFLGAGAALGAGACAKKTELSLQCSSSVLLLFVHRTARSTCAGACGLRNHMQTHA